mgnify:CR=1 FL=1
MKVGNQMKKYNKIITKELNRILPYHLLGIVFHTIVIYLAFKIPESIGKILDMLSQTNVDRELIMQETYWLIFYCAIVVIPRIIYRILFFTYSRKADTYLRKEVVKHLQKVKPEYFEKENKGAFLAYLSNEILSIRKILGNNWFNLDKVIITPIIAIILIWGQFNKQLALWLIPVFPIAGICMFYCYKKLKGKIEISRKTYVELSKNIEQNTDGFLLIKSYNQQEKQIEKFKNINSKMYKADYEIGVAKNNISRIINILYGVCFMIGFTVGIQYIVDGIMTVGELTAFIGYISNTLSNFVAGTQKLLERMPYMKQSLNRFNYFLNLDEYKKDGKSLEKINTIEVKHLSYWYDNTEKPALDNINMIINNGDKIGIIGQVGSGKTTLMNIISGFYEIPEGMVLINGEDIGKYKKDDLFSKYNYALQQNVILDDTIKANVDIIENLKKNEFKKIIKNAELEEDIEKLDKKEDTLVGEKGVKLSGGQKQRVSIARNLSNPRDINIFDDTLSALDSNTEKKIMNNLLNEVGDNTLIVISNKISSVEKLDKIYVLLDGKIEDCGTHKELLERNEFYKEVYMLEKKEEEDEIYTKEK